MNSGPHRLVVVSGPSCAGKSPLKKALCRQFPELFAPLQVPVLSTSRPRRPRETDGEDYRFRTRGQVEKLQQDPDYLVVQARSDLQAVDLRELSSMLEQGDVLYEGNVHVALRLMRAEALPRHHTLSVFVSPLSKRELEELQEDDIDLDEAITNLMRQRLMRRQLTMKASLALPDLEDVEDRARAAPHALRHAFEFDSVIVNHDGEDSDHWDLLGRPVGDARRATLAFAELLRGKRPHQVETWPKDLLPLLEERATESPK